jgi:plastocyanin
MKILSCLAFGAAVTLLALTPPPAAVVAEPQAAEDATLTGRVKIKGEIPKRRKINTNADPKCAAMHPGDLLTDDFVIDAAGNVQYALIYIKEGLGDQKFTAPKTPVVVEQKGCRFEPHVMGIMVGQELMFRNQDDLMHIVHVVPKNNREFGFSQAKRGEERPKVFAAKEVIRLFCDVHPWMVSWIHVMEHPFYTASGPDGKFKMKLPPGKYTIEAWHDGYKAVTQEVEIKAKETKTLNFELTDRQEFKP